MKINEGKQKETKKQRWTKRNEGKQNEGNKDKRLEMKEND